MLIGVLQGRVRIHELELAGSVEMTFRGGDYRPDGPVPCQCEQSLVELLVQPEERLELYALLVLLLEVRAKPAHDLRVKLRGEVGQRGQLHRLAQELGVGHLGGIDARDEGADLGEDLHEPLFREDDQALAHRRATHAQARGNLVLGERRARLQVERDDLATQDLIHNSPAAAPRLSCRHACSVRDKTMSAPLISRTTRRLIYTCSTVASWQRCRCCLLYTSPSPRDRQKSRMPS